MQRGEAKKRDLQREQQLVRDLWQQVEARIDISGALRAFLTQKIDDCGQTIALEAFDLVRQVLNPDGFVRRSHKSADQNLGAAIAAEESPWTAEGSLVHRQWDFHGAWHKNRKSWNAMNEYEELEDTTVETFCAPVTTIQQRVRHLAAKYKGTDEDLDKDYSMPKLGPDQAYLDILDYLPQESPPVIRRWETFRSVFPEQAFLETVQGKKWTGAATADSRKKKMRKADVEQLFDALHDAGAFAQYPSCAITAAQKKDIHGTGKAGKSNIEAWSQKLQELQKQYNDEHPDKPINLTTSSTSEHTIESLCTTDVKRLEPYWRWFWRNASTLPKSIVKSKFCTLIDRADLILEVGYFCADSGLFKKRVVVCEVDGADKTKHSDTKFNEAKTQITRPENDPIKLALKLMSSTVAQNAIQSETYHIRANYAWYNTDAIQKSLLSTTTHDLPDFAELIETLNKDKRTDDFRTLHHSIHLMHHMFLAHVKIAFLIHMQVVHDIDMRNDDVRDPTMRNHCFFVNFEATHIPEQLTWEDGPRQMPQKTKTWLQTQRMLHTRVLIKTYQADEEEKEAEKGDPFTSAMAFGGGGGAAAATRGGAGATAGKRGGRRAGATARGGAGAGAAKRRRGGESSSEESDGSSDSFDADNSAAAADEMEEDSDDDEEDQAVDEEKEKEAPNANVQWTSAPIMHASTKRAGMKDWNARVTSAQLPRFPFEKEVCVPVTCVSIQRVNMQELCKVVERAASVAVSMFNDARTLQSRDTLVNLPTEQKNVVLERRQFPDKCFLTRKEQHDKKAWWNESLFPLRNRWQDPNDDQLEFNWGYEDPIVQREFYTTIDIRYANNMRDLQWDQVDVRMYYFNQAIQGEPKWRELANGMWYVQDYNDFFNMLKRLDVPAVLPSQDRRMTLLPSQFDPTLFIPRTRPKAMENHDLKSYAYSFYALQKDVLPSDHPSDWHQCYYTPADKDAMEALDIKMPGTSVQKERAYHRFSVLSWFFDCRDAGACRYQWEDSLLEYFGAELPDDTESGLDQFAFETRAQFKSASTDSSTDTAYFDNRWFQMAVFLELNFRNAVAAMHFKLWDHECQSGNIPGASENLQGKAKQLFNRQRSLLNTRPRFAGLQGVSSGLSWQKNSQRNNLRALALSSLDDTLPGLDPSLSKYLQQFNAPNAALFMRMIEVSNVLALRELALQHKLASQTSPGASLLEQRLAWFEPAVQSEIRHILHCVERDDSVFTATPVVHPTKAVVLEEQLMRKWVRQTLEVHQHLHTLRCPLDVKFHMFTSSEMYRVFMQLFCTKTELDNSHTQRPVVFVLLQIYLALRIMRGTGDSNRAVDKVRRSNPLMCCVLDDLAYLAWNVRHTVDILTVDDQTVACTPGTSLETWPLRDQNLWCQPAREKEDKTDKTVIYHELHCTAFEHNEIKFTPNDTRVMQLDFPDEDAQMQRSMEDEELKRWLLLTYARPVHCQYAQADDKYTPGHKQHEFKTQDTVVLQQAEFPYTSRTGRERDTMIAAVSCVGVNAEHRLEVSICDDPDSHMFFEKIEQPHGNPPVPFPEYIQDIITYIRERTLIYIPPVFARHLRKENDIHERIYTHTIDTEKTYWRMACVGYRAWAWKRLLVKAVFFDALTKITTRSSLQLSLFEPVSRPFPADEDDAPDCRNKEIRDMISDTKDTFGELAFKTKHIENNLLRKQVQLIFTVFKKKRRVARIDERDFFFDTKTITPEERQAMWVKFVKDLGAPPATPENCRFMLIDKRMKEILPEDPALEMPSNKVLLYRSYLYTFAATTANVIRFQGNHYIKFPRAYAVLRHRDGTVHAGIANPYHDTQYYATCFDCRTYSHAQKELMRKPDSATTIRILRQYRQADLASKVDDTKMLWPSTAHDAVDACKYIGPNYAPRQVDPWILHTLPDMTRAHQQYMCTLPDVFKRRAFNDVIEELRDNRYNTTENKDWSDETFLHVITDDIFDPHALNRECNKLRNSSKYIGTRFTDDGTVTHVLKLDMPLDEPFKTIIAGIRRRIGARPNEDSP